MRLQKYFLVFLTTSLAIGLKSHKAIAFSLSGDISSKTMVYKDVAGRPGTITVKNVTLLDPPNKSGEFMETLKILFPSWTFKSESTSNKGFDVVRNIPAFLRYPGAEDPLMANVIGSRFELNLLQPPGSDFSRFHWIQRVKNMEASDRKGASTNFVDVPFFQTNPFYDLQFNPPLISSLFKDEPYTYDVVRKHTFDAELYLAEVSDPNNPTQPQEVTIYNGVSWGWRNSGTSPRNSQTFSGTLAAGQTDNYQVNQLTPGSKYTAWTNNDLPSNQCNPNTYLTASSPDGSIAYDDDSSPVGNGFASGLTGTVDNSGILNLAVQSVGARGQDKGNYELFVNVYNPEDSPNISNMNSGGGGFGKEMGGLTQQNSILPTSTQNGWQTFNKVPGCRWYDPHTTYGFEFQSLEDTLFTEILDFPVGEDTEFAVTVGNILLGTFGPGSSVDFVSLLGHPVNNFKITGINSLIGATAETAFPIQLAFDKPEGSFKMRAFSEEDAEDVPEPATVLGALLALCGLGALKRIKNRK